MSVVSLLSRSFYVLQEEGVTSLVRRSGSFVNKRAQKYIFSDVKRIYWRFKYGSSAPDHYELITVDPQEINCLVTPHFYNDHSPYSTHIVGGEWEQEYPNRVMQFTGSYESYDERGIIPLHNFVFFTSAKLHYEDDIPWDQTALYEFLVKNAGVDLKYRYRSQEAIDNALEAFDDLIETIESGGYRTQRELSGASNETLRDSDTLETPLRPSVPPEHDEVMIDIGAEGHIYFEEGRHRFVAAKIAGVKAIPVRVLVRHKEWQRLRTEVARASERSELDDKTRQLLDHPDLRQLAPK